LGLLFLLVILVLVVYAALVALVTGGAAEKQPLPVITIISPQDIVAVEEGKSFGVEALALGGYLVRAELWVDDRPVTAVTNPNPRWGEIWRVLATWEARPQGVHSILLRVYDSSGQVGISSPVTATIVPSLWLCFASNRDGNYELYKMKADGSEVKRLTFNEAQDREPSRGPDGSIVFASDRAEGQMDLWLMPGEDAEPVRLTRDPSSDREPLYSPDGRQIIFVSNRQGHEELYIMEAMGGKPVQLTQGNIYAGQPDWAPSGMEVVFAALRDGNWDIYRIRTDGIGLVRLTEDPAQDWHPAWSPGGDYIAFVSNRDGLHQIYRMRPDGSDVQKLTGLAAGIEQPVWSPDGHFIAFVAYTGDGKGLNAREIYIMRSDGSGPARLTYNAYDDTDLAWCEPSPSPRSAPMVLTLQGTPLEGGFRARYYANMTLSGKPVLDKVDKAVAFDWGDSPPAPGLPADHFSVQWEGELKTAASADYVFSVVVDDGVRLWVDDKLVIDEWHDQWRGFYSVPVHLKKGAHTIKLEYYDNEGPALIFLNWKVVGE